ncbi:MAG: hypothetical protein OXF02_06290 [Simkaniaceae bacterium]|nr:hypothetical protein [Simkaniaceae bacterium]
MLVSSAMVSQVAGRQSSSGVSVSDAQLPEIAGEGVGEMRRICYEEVEAHHEQSEEASQTRTEEEPKVDLQMQKCRNTSFVAKSPEGYVSFLLRF